MKFLRPTLSYCGVPTPREAHPIFFHHLLKGLDHGTVMYAIDPRRTASAKFADAWLGLNVGTDVAFG